MPELHRAYETRHRGNEIVSDHCAISHWGRVSVDRVPTLKVRPSRDHKSLRVTDIQMSLEWNYRQTIGTHSWKVDDCPTINCTALSCELRPSSAVFQVQDMWVSYSWERSYKVARERSESTVNFWGNCKEAVVKIMISVPKQSPQMLKVTQRSDQTLVLTSCSFAYCSFVNEVASEYTVSLRKRRLISVALNMPVSFTGTDPCRWKVCQDLSILFLLFSTCSLGGDSMNTCCGCAIIAGIWTSELPLLTRMSALAMQRMSFKKFVLAT